jgi:malate/lactate dehydrogenase
VEKVIEYELDDESKAKFAKSVEAIKANIAILENDGFFDD